MKIKAVAGWFGGNRTLAARVGEELGALDWCGVPFCGGCPELPAIDCRSGLATDLHGHVINLCRVVRSDCLMRTLQAMLESRLYHEDELLAAQNACKRREAIEDEGHRFESPDVAWAADYFCCCWMARGGQAGKRGEFDGGLSVRYTSSGGDSARRWMSAVESLPAWCTLLRRWQFGRIDAETMLGRMMDQPGHGVYCDPPWVGAGEAYRHPFSEAKHRWLAAELARFHDARVVVRYGDHPLIRELYPTDRWTWIEQQSRSQANGAVWEVLLVNGPSFTGGAPPA